MTFAQGAIGGIVYHQEWRRILYIKFEHTYNIWMQQARNSTCLGQKVFYIIAFQSSMEHFNGCKGIQVNMLAQVDFGKTALSNLAYEAIVA